MHDSTAAQVRGLCIGLLSVAFLLPIATVSAQDSRPADPPSAGNLPPGLYEVVSDDRGTSVSRTAGGKLHLGRRLSDTFGDVTMWSLSNNNDQFRVLIQRLPAIDVIGHVALFANGVGDVINSHSDPDESGCIEVTVDVYGADNARAVAEVLDVTPRLRTHPGHQFLVTWSTVEESYQPGNPVMVELQIDNVGTTEVRFFDGGQQRGARNNQFRFIAMSMSGFGPAVPDTGDPQHFGGLASLRTLKPGDTFRKQVDLSKWFTFTESGSYLVTGLFEIELMAPGNDHDVLWRDFAAGECHVLIEAATDGEEPGP